MKKERKESSFIKKPVYLGGSKAMKEFIAKELVYPKEALENKIEGTVRMRYDIDYKGIVFNVYILSGLLIFLVFNTIWNSGFHPIILAFFICIGILLYSSVKRKIEYKRKIKNGLQHRV